MAAIAAFPAALVAQVPSAVYSWSEPQHTTDPDTGDVRTVLEGTTTDLAYLRVRAVTLPPSAPAHALHNAGDGPAEYFAFQWR